MSKVVTLAIIGAGSRGSIYAQYALENPDKAKVVAVAEPRKTYRDNLAKIHNLQDEMVFESWQDVAVQDKIADAVIISTQDHMHVEPAVAFADLKYHILLEKPMAPTEEGCRTIVKATLDNEIQLSVCHVLRYTRYTQKLKELLNSGIIGDVISMQHLEPVAYWHQAHSFVRGNWRNQDQSTFMLLAKACHDLDWISYIMDTKCNYVSSFGHLSHFKKQYQPIGASSRCLDCTFKNTCAYSAKKIYLDSFDANCTLPSGVHKGFLEVITPNPTRESLEKALLEGDYGRCVYDCDNDVVDNQVVNMDFEGGKTVSFTMTAFTDYAERKTRIFGTKGMLEGDTSSIKAYEFLTDKTTSYDIEASDPDSAMTLHGGGDYEIMRSFIDAIRNDDENEIVSGANASLESHLMVFAAESARLNKEVVKIDLMLK
ncbi:Gfo/Idh/MocA family protein [Psychromonas ossibalaenae]|uniref:Gfo/Idh/MocA family protein n=1 Tax=Psychromonas ossibalaenae TaxID=444922 RepID=UPI000369C7D6|nr:Gfo/Idh/MocA family oxidoreductase [Psychromonas ossibalaenae]